MKLYVKNKLITIRGNSEILDEHSQPVYEVKGKYFTITNKKFIQDLEGNTLYIVRNSFIHTPFFGSAFLLDKDGKKLLKVKEKFGFGYKIESDSHDITIDGNVSHVGYYVYDKGNHIASIRRELTLIADAFEVEVMDNVDVPFVLALVICIDNIGDNTKN